MPDFIDGSENVSVHGIFNWILLLLIFSIITVIGNYLGYKHPIGDSFIGMGILSLITLVKYKVKSSILSTFLYVKKIFSGIFNTISSTFSMSL